MAKTKISTLAKDLNVALPTVIEFLRKKNISIDVSPNTRVEDDVVALLMSEFKHDKDMKPQVSVRAPKPAPATPKKSEAPKAEEPVKTETAAGPRILGKLELDKKGNPVVKKAETPKAPEPQPVVQQASEPKPKPEPAPEAKTEVEKPAPAPAPAPKAAAAAGDHTVAV